jgi:hypothetical protein
MNPPLDNLAFREKLKGSSPSKFWPGNNEHVWTLIFDYFEDQKVTAEEASKLLDLYARQPRAIRKVYPDLIDLLAQVRSGGKDGGSWKDAQASDRSRASDASRDCPACDGSGDLGLVLEAYSAREGEDWFDIPPERVELGMRCACPHGTWLYRDDRRRAEQAKLKRLPHESPAWLAEWPCLWPPDAGGAAWPVPWAENVPPRDAHGVAVRLGRRVVLVRRPDDVADVAPVSIKPSVWWAGFLARFDRTGGGLPRLPAPDRKSRDLPAVDPDPHNAFADRLTPQGYQYFLDLPERTRGRIHDRALVNSLAALAEADRLNALAVGPVDREPTAEEARRRAEALAALQQPAQVAGADGHPPHSNA